MQGARSAVRANDGRRFNGRVAVQAVAMHVGLVQTLAGAVVFLIYARCEHFTFGAVVTVWKRAGGVSLGMFIFIASERAVRRGVLPEKARGRIVVHEYGHSVQSLILGPLYLPVIGLPSIIWAGAPSLCEKRRRGGISYYSFRTERIANRPGELATGKPSMENIDVEACNDGNKA